MKRRIYTISLLLSFLVILSHEMIPHHHHGLGLSEFSSFHNRDEHYAHQKLADHHHHDADQQNPSKDSEKEHKHKFPFHHHISPNNDFDYLRIKSIRNIEFKFSLLTVFTSFVDTSLTEPPELDSIRFTDKPFLIKTLFEPGAIGLRGPPSIA